MESCKFFPTTMMNGQMRFNGGYGKTSIPMPGLVAQEEEVAEFKLWSSNSRADPNELRNCALNSILTREYPVKYEQEKDEEEDELQGLVSNILDEGDNTIDKMGKPPNVNGLWNPKNLRQDFLQHSKSAERLPNGFSNSEDLIRSQTESKNVPLFQSFSGTSPNPNWHVRVPNREVDDFISYPKRSPPGLPIPQRAKQFPQQTRLSKYDMLANMQPAYNRPINDLPQVAQFLNKLSRPTCDLNENAMSAKLIGNNVQEQRNHMISGLPSVLVEESDQGRYGRFPNTERKTEYPEDSILLKWKFPSQAMPMFYEKQPKGEFWGQNVTPAWKQNNFQEMLQLASENAEYCPPKSFPRASNPKNDHFLTERNHCSNPQPELAFYKMKSQIQKEKKMRDFTREWPQVTARVAKTHLSPPIDQLGDVVRFNGEDIVENVVIPLVNLNGEPRRFSQLPFKSQKDTNPLEKGLPDFTPTAIMNGIGGAKGSYGHLNGSEARYSAGSRADWNSVLVAPLDRNPQAFVSPFSFHLEECFEQLGYLEGERKKMELHLANLYPCKWTPSSRLSDSLPIHLARIDRLIVKLLREEANVECLLHKMERICKVPIHANIRLVLKEHRQAITCIQVRRKEELAIESKHHWNGGPLKEDRDQAVAVTALGELAMTTKKLRTCLWCTFQMILPNPVGRSDDRHTTSREEMHT
ncbi:uncharacterized protein moto [Stigmatopora argus]